MKLTIVPSVINGIVTAPASKSAMQRACAMALLHKGETLLHNAGTSNDDLAALSIVRSFGATTTALPGHKMMISSSGYPLPVADGTIDCGESGLSIRMFTPVAALLDSSVQITGSGSLLSRPMDFFETVLPQLGVSIQSNNGRLPLAIKGPLQPAEITVDGSLSSQFLTGLLLAFAKSATAPVRINVLNLKSRPYIDLTLQVMKIFGYNIVNHQYESFDILPANMQEESQVNFTVEGDWSGAAFLLVAGAIAGNITVRGLDVFSVQADKAILQALMMAKANISITEAEIVVQPKSLQPFHFNATDCPDLFPPLVALAAYCEGSSVIEGVSRLSHKESDRGISLQEEFGKMGVIIKLQDDLMIIEGGSGLHAAAVYSHHDHRIAMATAVAALKATGQTEISGAEAINKSYPDFYKHLETLGAIISTDQP
ncbi:MAG: aroA [Ferruginibacter sp.]|nr:aroA [Ferruginibacter sp.]